jgi:Tol biopolymer transport system component
MRSHRPISASSIQVVWATLVLSCSGDDGVKPGEPEPEPPISAPAGRIAFVRDPWFTDPEYLARDIYVINADGSDRRPLVADGMYNEYPAWTPDGRAVLFSRKPDIQHEAKLTLIDADGGSLRPFGAELSGTQPRWAPDGKRVAWLAKYLGDSGGPHPAGIWIANPDGSEPRRVPTHNDDFCAGYCSWVGFFRWYPDADRIGYDVPVGTMFGHIWQFTTELYTTRLSDSSIEPLVGPLPIWARDGSRLVILMNDLLRIMAPDGTPLATIPVPGGLNDAVWSPDGQWLAYVFMAEGAYQLWVADRDGNRRRRIALHAHSPDWQPTPAAMR